MARFNSGWIKIYRDLADGDIGQDPFILGTFIKLLLWANWRDGNSLLAGKRAHVEPGQVVTGLRELSKDVEIDPYLHRIRRALRYLETRGTITQKTSNRGRIITICNWESYQGGDDDLSKPSASREQAERRPSANRPQLIEESKKEERRKKRGESAVALPRLAEIWNQNRGSLSEVRGCSGTRRKHAELRWREEPSPEYWTRIVQCIARSPFCTGDNERGWRADFDFLIRPETRHKVEEGKYDEREGRGAINTKPVSLSAEDKAEAEMLENIRRSAIEGRP